MAKMTPEQEALRDYMSELSEDYYCAGWLVDLEYVLWDVLEGNKNAFAGGELKDEEIQKLRDLSAKCEGWIYWDDDHETHNPLEFGESFIPLGLWKIKFAVWKENRRGQRG